MPLTAIKKQDPEVNAALADEMREQEQNLELIASENYVSQTELEAQGSLLTNKYASLKYKTTSQGCDHVAVSGCR